MRLQVAEFRKLYDEATRLIHLYSQQYEVEPHLIRKRYKSASIVTVRRAVAKELRSKYVENLEGRWELAENVFPDDPNWMPLSYPNIGKLLHKDHSSVIGWLKEKADV